MNYSYTANATGNWSDENWAKVLDTAQANDAAPPIREHSYMVTRVTYDGDKYTVEHPYLVLGYPDGLHLIGFEDYHKDDAEADAWHEYVKAGNSAHLDDWLNNRVLNEPAVNL